MTRVPAPLRLAGPRFVAVLGLAGLVQLAFVALAGTWEPPRAMGVTVALVALIAAVLACAAAAPVLSRRGVAFVAIPVLGLVGLGLAGVDTSSIGALLAVTACLLSAGSLVGAAVGGRIAHPGYLVVVAYVSSLADLYSVFTPSGPTARVVRSATLLPLLAVSWPVPGVAPALPLLGIADVVMAALYLAATRRHALGTVRTTVALGAGFLLTFALAALTGMALPALPLLGLAVVAAHREARRVPRAERRTAWIGALILTAVFGALVLVHVLVA